MRRPGRRGCRGKPAAVAPRRLLPHVGLAGEGTGRVRRPGQVHKPPWTHIHSRVSRSPTLGCRVARWTAPREVPAPGRRPSYPAPTGWHPVRQTAVSALVDGFKYLHVASGE